ncbi:MAG: SRPBCC domain-containing protein [Hyphomicrobiaceae bacterium]
MSSSSAHFATLVWSRNMADTQDALFEALTSRGIRERLWHSDAEMVVVPVRCDTRVGGQDVLRFGPRTNPRFEVVCRYHDIVPARRIIATEVISDAGEIVCISLVAWEIGAREHGVQLRLTAKLVLLDPAGSSDVARLRHETAIEALDRFMSAA